jgi:hypothetical protein
MRGGICAVVGKPGRRAGSPLDALTVRQYMHQRKMERSTCRCGDSNTIELINSG